MEEKNHKENNINGAANDVEQPEGVVEEEDNRKGDKIITEEVNASVDRNGRHHVEKEKVIGKEDDIPNFDIFSFQTQLEVEGKTKEKSKEEREKNEMNTEKGKAADMWGMSSQEDSQFVKEMCKNVEEVEKVALQSTYSEKLMPEDTQFENVALQRKASEKSNQSIPVANVVREKRCPRSPTRYTPSENIVEVKRRKKEQ
ncbi:unnamed protein product [Cuscuta europaea]|uniref:Uncharacterized protein n=1 Tax=Cuscuta europaea TaxID=41803 RepID=A0A9P0ZA26_CUSEU|nr:unnamed protein product [Cuscuta europaea]